MPQHGFKDVISNVLVGPVSREVVERVRQSFGNQPDTPTIVYATTTHDFKKFDCTYVEWIKNHRGHTTRVLADKLIQRIGSAVSTTFVSLAVLERTVDACLRDETRIKLFMAAICRDMAHATDDPVGKEAWLELWAKYVAPPE